MSDLCMYELEDITWDDVCQCDDHIVPLPGDEQASEHLFQNNSRKKTRQEVTCVASDTGGAFSAEAISQEQETLAPHGRWNEMLVKEGWSQKSDGVSSYGRESMKEVSSLASGGTRNILHCIDSILNDKSAAVGSSFGYPLDQMSEADNNLGFFSNNHEDKDSNDLYYCWPDIENFEDFDQMFRSSAFELGARKEDDLDWFSSSGAVEGSEDAFSYLDSNSQKTTGENHDASRLNGVSGPIEKSDMQSFSFIYEGKFWPSVDDESVSLGHLPASNVSDGSESNDGVLPKGQIDERRKQLKHHNQSARSRNDQSLENDSFLYVDNMAELVPQQKQVSDSDTYRYLRSDTPPHMSSERSCALDHTSMHPTLSAVKLENSSLNSLSAKDSYALNKSQSKENCQASLFQGTSIASMDERKKLHQQQGFQAYFESNPKNVGLPVQASTSDTNPVENLVYFSGDELKNYTEIGGVDTAILGKVGSSVAQEGPSTNSGIDDISREAASVRQLQLVLEQLDLRTKLCIRDSLYRLAWSAEQRHNHIPLNSSPGEDGGANGVLFAEGTNKYIGFLDMETETNPIDRSMAHLLYHRPTGSPAVEGHESVSFNSPMPASL